MPINMGDGLDRETLGRFLQLSSAALPVGAFAYSEGLERLVGEGVIGNAEHLRSWLEDHLYHGPVRVEAAILSRIWTAAQAGDVATTATWDAWFSATRESEELRQQSRHMGRALWRLFRPLGGRDEPAWAPENFVTAYAVVAADWDVPLPATVYGYLHTWASNLVIVGVKLIPLGQMVGQHLIWQLQAAIADAAEAALVMLDDDLSAWGIGLALASMGHETQYSRLFRS